MNGTSTSVSGRGGAVRLAGSCAVAGRRRVVALAVLIQGPGASRRPPAGWRPAPDRAGREALPPGAPRRGRTRGARRGLVAGRHLRGLDGQPRRDPGRRPRAVGLGRALQPDGPARVARRLAAGRERAAAPGVGASRDHAGSPNAPDRLGLGQGPGRQRGGPAGQHETGHPPGGAPSRRERLPPAGARGRSGTRGRRAGCSGHHRAGGAAPTRCG